jgi:hypothetical protein
MFSCTKERSANMGTQFTYITDEQADLIRNSPVFFVASVATDLSAGPER